MSAMINNSYYLVVDDLNTIKQVYNALSGNQGDMGDLSYHYAFDVDDEKDAQISLVSTLRKAVQELNVD
ncbi:MAG: hypothetical protein WBI44_08740, partial [Syntrophaceticus sp.]